MLLRLLGTLNRKLSSLVIAEETGNILNDWTKSAISASLALENDITCLIASSKHTQTLADQIGNVSGVKEIIICEDPQFDSYSLTSLIMKVVKEGSFTHIVGGSSSHMRDCLARVSAKLGVGMFSDVTAVIDQHTFERRIYAGNITTVLTSRDNIKVMTVRSFPSPTESKSETQIRVIPPISTPSGCTVVSRDIPQLERPSLTTAKVVVSGGRGLKTVDNFSLVYQLADSLNAAVGATRAAVDAGFVSNELQVGQTGKVVSPELYITVGVSGAIQHITGMRDSKTVVAIDKNESAPIFEFCDYGVIGDLFEVVPQLTQLIKDS